MRAGLLAYDPASRIQAALAGRTPYPLTEPSSIPLLKYYCRNGYTTSSGSAVNVTAAIRTAGLYS
ncbi:hypothetical protein [Paenibacillus naphthalenovorans]|uniref:hypothetical protein n=1 Tax=Paenibacillus naphthalenovorans TaxID=162209 RepID=UPI0009446B52|nr:hypothetical protein [Paenibacillus naphthalenovorans]